MKFKNKETNETVEAKNFTELFAYSNNSNWEKVVEATKTKKTTLKED